MLIVVRIFWLMVIITGPSHQKEADHLKLEVQTNSSILVSCRFGSQFVNKKAEAAKAAPPADFCKKHYMMGLKLLSNA